MVTSGEPPEVKLVTMFNGWDSETQKFEVRDCLGAYLVVTVVTNGRKSN